MRDPGAGMSGSGVVLGFDFGTRRIGVAVGESVTGSARPLASIAVRHDRPDWDGIRRLIDTWRPEGLVVGLPLQMDGGEQDTTVAALRFGRQLAGRYGLPVHTMDERLTTRAAATLLEDKGRRVTGDDLDPVAASLILESWLRQQAGG